MKRFRLTVAIFVLLSTTALAGFWIWQRPGDDSIRFSSLADRPSAIQGRSVEDSGEEAATGLNSAHRLDQSNAHDVSSNRNSREGAPENGAAPEQPRAASPFESYVESIASDSAELHLPEHERDYLWKIEQCAFELERHVFPSLAAALQANDRDVWQRVLAPGFEANVPTDITSALGRSFVRVDDWRVESGSLRVIDRSAFLDFVFGLRERFQDSVTVQFGLPRLSPVARGQLDGAWAATVKLDMRGSLSSGKSGEAILYAEASFARLSPACRDEEDWIERFDLSRLTWSRGPEPLLVDVAGECGLEPERFHDNWSAPAAARKVVTGGIYLCDYNQDGWLDVMVTDLRGNVLYRGTPQGRFEDATADAGLADLGAGGVAAFADLDNDGDEDLIATAGARLSFYRNLGNGRFGLVRSTRPPRSVISITLADFDGDGFVDLYLPGDAPVPFFDRGQSQSTLSYIDDRTGRANVLFRNRGQWRFENVSDEAHVAGGGSSDFTAVWLDANSDGKPDVVTANELGANLYALNQGGGRFRTEVLERNGVPAFSMGASAGDFNNDGMIDLYVSNMYSKAGSRVIGNVESSLYPAGHFEKILGWVAGNSLYRNQGEGQFENVGRKLMVHDVGFAYGSSFVDLDNDGWLDVYALAGFHSVSRTEPDG